MNTRLSDELALVSVIDADAYGAGTTANGTVIDMKDHEQVMFVLSLGTMGASSTVDYAIYGDTASGGSFATALTGKTATQLTQAGSDDDKQVVITVTQDEVTNQGFRYIQDELVVTSAVSDSCAIAVATTRYKPASNFNLSTVDETLN